MPTLSELREKLRAGESPVEPERNQMPGGAFEWKWWNLGNTWYFRCGDHVAVLHCAQVSSVEGGISTTGGKATALTKLIFEDLGWPLEEEDWWAPTYKLIKSFVDRAPGQNKGTLMNAAAERAFKPSKRLVETLKLEMERRKETKKKPGRKVREVKTLSARDKLVRVDGMLVRVDGHHLYKWIEKLGLWNHEGAR